MGVLSDNPGWIRGVARLTGELLVKGLRQVRRVTAVGILLLVGPFRVEPCAQPAPDSPNVLLITIDTLRADHLGTYGYSLQTDPNLQKLAEEALVYRDVTTSVPLTLPSHVSLLTGLYPIAHGVRDNGSFWRGNGETLPELFQQQGYETAAWVSSFVLSSRFGLARGFDLYDDYVVDTAATDSHYLERKAGDTIGRVNEWLDRRRSQRPFFAWVHLFDPHGPYIPPAPYDRQFDSAYDGEVAYSDWALGQLVSELRKLGLWEKTIVVVTSDHGEGLGDHGENTHGYFVYQSTLQIPLVIKPAGEARMRRDIGRPVHLVDVAPTVLRLSGLQTPGGFQGRVLTELLGRDPGQTQQIQGRERELYAESLYFQLKFGWAPYRVYRRGRWKLIESPGSELYDLSQDPGEEKNLAEVNRTLVSALEEQLDRLVERKSVRGNAVPADVGPDPETVAKLRSLGYSALRIKSAAEPVEKLPDPKNHLEVFRRVKEAERLLVGDPAAAIVELREVVTRYPKVVRARELLALALEDEGRWAEAKSVYEALLEEYPASPQVMLQLAVVCGHLEDPGRGIALLESSTSLDPENFLIHYHLGVFQSQTGRLTEASESYRESIRLQPEYAKSHYGLGQVLIKERKIADAQRHFQKAVDLDAGFKEAYHNLGLCLAVQGNLEDAVVSWKRALEIDPSYASSRKNLIQALEDLGRSEEAARLK